MKKGVCIALAIATLVVGGCKTMFTKGGGDYRDGDKAYKKGAYDEAAQFAIEALGKNPEYAEAKDLLSRSTKEGPDALLKEIEALKSGGKAFAIDEMYAKYKTLDKINKVVSASALAAQYPTKSYEAEMKAAFDQACAEHYAAGAAESKKGGFRAARAAREQFLAVQRYTKNYKDTAALLAKAQEEAIALVAVVESGNASGAAAGAIKAFKASKELDQGLTSFIGAAELGLAGSVDAAKALAAAKAKGADFVVVIEAKGSSEQQNIQKGIEQVTDGVFKVSTMAYGYKQSIAAGAQAYEVSTGQALGSRKESSKSASDSITIRKVTGEYAAELNLQAYGKGKFKVYDSPSLAAVNPGGSASKTFSDLINNASNISVEALKTAADFAALKKLCDGMIAFSQGVVILHTLDDSKYSPFFDDDLETSKRLATNSAAILRQASDRAQEMAIQAMRNYSGLAAQAGEEIAAAIAANLK